MRFDLGTLDSGERSLPYGLLVDRIIIKVAGNQDRHKNSVVFILGRIRDQSNYFGVNCPWVTKISDFWTWISLKPVGQLWSYFMCSIIGVEERLHELLGRLDQNCGFHGSRKPPLTYNGENGVSTFSWLFLIRSFLYLQVTRTCKNLPLVRILARSDHWLWS